MSDRIGSANSSLNWLRTPWGRIYLVTVGLALTAAVAVQVGVKAQHGQYVSMDKPLRFLPVALALDVLFAIGIAVTIYRSRFWRHATTGLHVLLGVALFFLGSAAAFIFVFVGCLVGSNY